MSSPAFGDRDQMDATKLRKIERLYQNSKLRLKDLTPKQRLADLYLGVQGLLDTESEDLRVPMRRVKKFVDSELQGEELTAVLSKTTASMPGNARVKEMLRGRPSMNRRGLIGGAVALASLALVDRVTRSSPSQKVPAATSAPKPKAKALPKAENPPLAAQVAQEGGENPVEEFLFEAAGKLPGPVGSVAPSAVTGVFNVAETSVKVVEVTAKVTWTVVTATIAVVKTVTPWLWKGSQVAIDTTQNVILPTTQRVVEESKDVLAPAIADGVEKLAPVVQDGVEKAMPIVKDAYSKVEPSVGPYINKAGSSVNEAISATKPAVEGAKAAMDKAQTQISPALPVLKAIGEFLKNVFSWAFETSSKLSTQGTDAVANEVKSSVLEGVKSGAGAALDVGKTVGKQAIDVGSSKAGEMLKGTVNTERLNALGDTLNSVKSSVEDIKPDNLKLPNIDIQDVQNAAKTLGKSAQDVVGKE